MTRDWTVREAATDDLASVLGVLDAGALETDADRVRASIDRGETLVAVRDATDPDDGGDRRSAAPRTVLGALVLVEPDDVTATGSGAAAEIDAVSVRPGRRGRGIGRALVAAAAERYDALVAEFDGGVRPFYEALGFAIEPSGETVDAGRYRGVLADGD